jgi:hypothetical protein
MSVLRVLLVDESVLKSAHMLDPGEGCALAVGVSRGLRALRTARHCVWRVPL